MASRPARQPAPERRADAERFAALARALVDAAVEARARVLEGCGEDGVASTPQGRRRKAT